MKVYKVIVIGDASVGKTAFIKTYLFDAPTLDNSGTVGVDFVVKTLPWKNNEVVKLQIWDIGGQDRSPFLMRSFCHRSHGCVLMFDVTNANSFTNVIEWKKQVDDKCLCEGRKPIPCLLLANKCDLDERSVRLKEIDAVTQEYNFLGWKEVSVKDRLNVNESMELLVDTMLQHNYVISTTGNVGSGTQDLHFNQGISTTKQIDYPAGKKKPNENCCC